MQARGQEQEIVIYGTGVCAKLVYYGLEQQGISVKCFADKTPKESFMGAPVLSLEELKAYVVEEKPIIILGVTKALKSVVKQLEEIGINHYYYAYDILKNMKSPEKVEDVALWNFHKTIWMYKFYEEELAHPQSLYIESLDVVVSERCSLRCKDCSNLMQYYVKPVDLDMETLHMDLERFLCKVDCIGELRILGGEPFMCHDFYKLISWYADDSRIMKIGIYSNATIMPQEDILEYLKHDRIIMHLSDYGMLSRNLQQWVEFCEENSVQYIVSKMTEWHDCGLLQSRKYTKEQIKNVYSNCECRGLPTLLHGYLYNCPYAAHACNLGALSNDEMQQDFLSFREEACEYSQETIKKFLFEREYLAACDYCSGRNFNLKTVPPHIQAKAPLPYERKRM